MSILIKYLKYKKVLVCEHNYYVKKGLKTCKLYLKKKKNPVNYRVSLMDEMRLKECVEMKNESGETMNKWSEGIK